MKLIKSLIKFLSLKIFKNNGSIFFILFINLTMLLMINLTMFLYFKNKQFKKEIDLYKQVIKEKEHNEKMLNLQLNKCNENYEVLYDKYNELINQIKKKEIEMNKLLKEYIEKEKRLSEIHRKYKIEIDKTKNECENMKELIKKLETINY